MGPFDDVLRDAVEDISVHGYDDRGRIDSWVVKLREAESASMISEEDMKRRLTSALDTAYRRHMKSTQLLKRHQGLSKFKLQQLEPSLRRELNRRILASAGLISLNRQASIQRTLHRFEGWATSVPKGGSRAIDRREVTKNLRKAFASLPFEERRVVIDQGHKLISSISNIVATDGGAIAAIWHSHWREVGYDYRPRHKQLDDRIFVMRDNWAIRDGLMKLGGRFYTDQIEAPAEQPFCRCYYTYLYALGDLPDDMLTAKGRMALKGEHRVVNG